MGLVQVDTFTIGSAVASVIIGGGSSGSSSTNFAINTDDVYMVALNNVQSVNDNVGVYIRVTTSGTADSDSQYNYANKGLRADTTFDNNSNTNQDKAIFGISGTGTGEIMNGIFYLFNFNNASEYSFLTQEVSYRNATGVLKGDIGGVVHTVAEANDGVNIFMQSGNIASGTFTLYKVI